MNGVQDLVGVVVFDVASHADLSWPVADPELFVSCFWVAALTLTAHMMCPSLACFIKHTLALSVVFLVGLLPSLGWSGSSQLTESLNSNSSRSLPTCWISSSVIGSVGPVAKISLVVSIVNQLISQRPEEAIRIPIAWALTSNSKVVSIDNHHSKKTCVDSLVPVDSVELPLYLEVGLPLPVVLIDLLATSVVDITSFRCGNLDVCLLRVGIESLVNLSPSSSLSGRTGIEC